MRDDSDGVNQFLEILSASRKIMIFAGYIDDKICSFAKKIFADDKLVVIITDRTDNAYDCDLPEQLILEFFGNREKLLCNNCDLLFDTTSSCSRCGDDLVSSMIDFGELIPGRRMTRAKEFAMEVDLCVVFNSELNIQPAASFPRIVALRNKKLVIVNDKNSNLDFLAYLKLDTRLFSSILAELQPI